MIGDEKLPFPASGSPSAEFCRGKMRSTACAALGFSGSRKRNNPHRERDGDYFFGAGDENRTHNRSLGSSYFTTKLRPQTV